MRVDDKALQDIMAEAPRYATEGKETGGTLFGYHYADGTSAVLHAIGPGPNAKREWALFNPDADWTHEQARLLFDQDENLSYVGCWHTHPPGYPHASPDDDHAGWTHAEYKDTPSWLEVIVVVDESGAITRIRTYRYKRGRVKEELHDIPLESGGTSA